MKSAILGAALIAASTTGVFAHATFEDGTAAVKSTYKAVLRVPHGCEGSPTLKVRVQIPEGFIAVKPMPKAGWTLETVTGKYKNTYKYFGSDLSEGVTEIIWTGKLLDEHYDEFVFRGRFADTLEADTVVYFPSVQECEKGAERWIEIPAAGQDPHALDAPAPGVKLVPAKSGH